MRGCRVSITGNCTAGFMLAWSCELTVGHNGSGALERISYVTGNYPSNESCINVNCMKAASYTLDLQICSVQHNGFVAYNGKGSNENNPKLVVEVSSCKSYKCSVSTHCVLSSVA